MNINGTHISIGVIIAIILIFYWWHKDHPSAEPVRTGYETHLIQNV